MIKSFVSSTIKSILDVVIEDQPAFCETGNHPLVCLTVQGIILPYQSLPQRPITLQLADIHAMILIDQNAVYLRLHLNILQVFGQL